jgi:hypothetical protein
MVPATEFGGLTMLKSSGDDFVSVELVHDPEPGRSTLAASTTS